jgi:hypothetical protein
MNVVISVTTVSGVTTMNGATTAGATHIVTSVNGVTTVEGHYNAVRAPWLLAGLAILQGASTGGF